MKMGKISPLQLFCLMVLFELGSAVVVGVGLEAKQDAWLAILLGMAGGGLLFLLYSALFDRYPDLSLTAYIPRIVGKWIGIPVSVGYLLYFLYIASRVLRDFGDLLITSALTETPLLAVNGLMMLVVAYAVYMGIEVIGRTGEPVFVIMLSSLFLGMVLLVLSDKIEFTRLLPFLENGWKPVLSTTLKQTYTFPYGEMIVFAMLLPMLDRPKEVRRTGLYAILFSGLVLSATITCDIVVLGVQQAARSQFPLLETFTRVKIGEVVQRLDILVISMLILGMFIKIVIFFYAGVAGFNELFRFRTDRHPLFRSGLVLVLASAVLVSSYYMSSSFTEHIEVGLKWVPIRLHWPIQSVIPILLFAVIKLRKPKEP